MFKELNKLSSHTLFSICIRQKSSRKLENLLLSMPKEKPHTVVLKAQRTQMKEKGKKYIPGVANLQVLGSGARGAPRALYLFTDQSRYLFNCGEGSQRLAHEHKMKLSKLEHIFITGSSWENIGGLPGVALTIQDVGVPEITLHGPEGIDNVFAATRKFVVLKDLSVQMADCRKENFFEDSGIIVKYIPLKKSDPSLPIQDQLDEFLTENKKSNVEIEDNTDYYAHEKHFKRRKIDNKTSGSNSKKEEPVVLQNQGRPNIVMSYVVQLKEKPGSLSIEKCAALDVPPGPLLGKLKGGEDVTLPDGRVIKSSDVTSPPQKGPVFIVLECPSEEYLDSLVEEKVFKCHQGRENSKEEDWAFIVAHFTPLHIMSHPKYKNWMDEFRASTYHLVLNNCNSCLGSIAVHRIQTKLNLIDKNVFPLLRGDGIEGTLQESHKCVEKCGKNSLENVFQSLTLPGHTFTTIGLRPKTFIDSTPLKLTANAWAKEVENLDGWKDVLKNIRSSPFQSSQHDFPSVLFLGTGSCIPNKTRNTSAILLDISQDESILMDCGEGSFGQLVRFGESQTVLRRLKGIFISHLHADHHMGLIGILKGREKAFLEVGNVGKSSVPPLLLLAPSQISIWLKYYHNCFEPILDGVKLVPNADLLLSETKIRENICQYLGIGQIATARVKHCPNSFAVSIILKDGWKVTYSGDTMPCASLVELAKNSDLLIHEATMEDDLLEEAEIKMHSTVSQAINIGKQAKAKAVILTHFSQRYAKLPRMQDDIIKQIGLPLGIAFDNMKVRRCDLERLPSFYLPLKTMFQEDYEELEQKALKRQYKMERLQKQVSPSSLSFV